MTMAPTLQSWLHDHHLRYDIVEHPPTGSALGTALVCGIPSQRVAKAVLLRDGADYMLAVLPASSRIDLTDLAAMVEGRPHLATEPEIGRLFADCASGAVPAAGECYGIDVLVDESIEAQPEVYFEGGDHATLVHMNHASFAAMMSSAEHGRFSTPYGDNGRWHE